MHLNQLSILKNHMLNHSYYAQVSTVIQTVGYIHKSTEICLTKLNRTKFLKSSSGRSPTKLSLNNSTRPNLAKKLKSELKVNHLPLSNDSFHFLAQALSRFAYSFSISALS